MPSAVPPASFTTILPSPVLISPFQIDPAARGAPATENNLARQATQQTQHSEAGFSATVGSTSYDMLSRLGEAAQSTAV